MAIMEEGVASTSPNAVPKTSQLTSVGGSGAAKIALPDRWRVDDQNTAATLGPHASGVNTGQTTPQTVTTVLADMSITADRTQRVTLCGTGANDLYLVGSGAYAPRWKTNTAGAVGSTYGITWSWAVEFNVTGSRYLGFGVRTELDVPNGAGFRIIVDGRRVANGGSNGAVMFTGYSGNGSANRIDLDLGDNAQHHVRLELSRNSLAKIYGGAAGTIWPAAKSKRLFVLGDSLTSGTAQNTGGPLGTYLYHALRFLGINDVWESGIAGAGPNTLASGVANTNYKTRVTTELIPAVPDLVLVGTNGNDGIIGAGRSSALQAADFVTICNTINTGLAVDPPIVAMLVPDGTGSSRTASLTADEDAIIAALTGTPNLASVIAPATGRVVFRDGTVLRPAGTPWIVPGNVSLYVGADTVHPVDAGAQLMGRKVFDDLYLILRKEGWAA